MKSQKETAIILVNYNGFEDTKECITSIKSSSYKDFHIFVVDNNSSDQNNLLSLADGQTTIIYLNENTGFSAANNVGIKQAINLGFKYICLLNNDTIVDVDCFTNMTKKVKNANNFLATGVIYHYYDRDKIWYSSGKISKHAFIAKHLTKPIDKTIFTRFVSGCFQFMDQEFIKNVGFYDEDYFLYNEDVDFCIRANKKNLKMFVINDAYIYHKEGATTKKKSKVTYYYSTRNSFLVIKKNQSSKFIKFFLYTYILIRKLLSFPKKVKGFKYVLLGISDFFKGKVGYKDLNNK